MDAITAGFCADIYDGVSLASGTGVEDLVATNQTKGESVDEGIAGVGAFEFSLAAKVRHAKTVSIRGNSAHYPFEYRMVLVDCGVVLVGSGTGFRNGTKT